MTTLSAATYQRPWMYPKQRAAIFTDARGAVVEASTKSGKTVACMVWLAEQAMAGGPGRNYWWVAPIYPQAKIAFRRLKRGLPRELYVANESELTITLPNGAVIWFKGADKPDSLYGEDVYAAVIDEASRCREEAWHAVRTTLTQTQGPVRIIGNVKGRKNWAYKLARRAEAGTNGWHYAKITAHDAVDAGVLAAAEIESAREDLPEDVFRELYEAEPTDDGSNPFGLDHIRACASPRLSLAEPAAWGWDLAKSVDWTWGIAMDRAGGVCVSERWQGPWEQTTRRIEDMTKGTPAWVDSTGVGDPIVERLREKCANLQGLKFTAQSKQQLMEGLAVAIQRHEITFPEGLLVTELEEFEYTHTRTGVAYSAPEGMHDDGVMALALAVKAWRVPKWDIY